MREERFRSVNWALKISRSTLPFRAMKALELGCGTREREGVTGVDINPRVDPDVLHDLDIIPYPFADDEFDEIHCHDVLEHLSDLPAVMQELHRILPDGGTLHISGPFPSGSGYVTDPVVQGNKVTVEVGFGGAAKDYVVVQHEDLTLSHPVGEAKFLERAFDEHSVQAAGKVAKIAKRLVEQ